MGKYSLAYTAIIRDRRLSTDAKALYVYLKSYTSAKRNACWPPIPRMAKDLSKGQRSIRYMIAELVRFRVIAYNRGHQGKANTYFLQDEKAATWLEHNPYPFLPPDPYPKLPPSVTHREDRVNEEPEEDYGT